MILALNVQVEVTHSLISMLRGRQSPPAGVAALPVVQRLGQTKNTFRAHLLTGARPHDY